MQATDPLDMKSIYLVHAGLLLVLLAGGCAQMRETRTNVAGNRYLDCLHAAAATNMDNPAGADDIAAAAHGRCWSEWNAYRDQILTTYTARARTADELQLGQDKAHAHLRQFEADARRAVVSAVVQRSYGVPTPRQ